MQIKSNISGRERLLQAAVVLGAEKRSLADVGVRELTRAAGLSPGAFYRHFNSADELGGAVIATVDAVLRASLMALWHQLSTEQDLTRLSLRLYFDLALSNEPAFVVCARERYGASGELRQAMSQLQQGLARELSRALAATPALGSLPLTTLEATSLDVIEQLNLFMLDYVLADKSGREAIHARAETFVQRQFAGALSLHRRGQSSARSVA